jgi:hypothetical protein
LPTDMLPLLIPHFSFPNMACTMSVHSFPRRELNLVPSAPLVSNRPQ